jgi:hypothetical protein
LETVHKMEDTSKIANIQGMNFSSTAEWELDEMRCRIASIYKDWLDECPTITISIMTFVKEIEEGASDLVLKSLASDGLEVIMG